jgi:hypothetical protein
MDALVITGVITGLSGLLVAVLTHLKHSDCCKGFISFETREVEHIRDEREPKETQI